MTRIITRRDFVRGAAVAGATTSLSQLIGCRTPLLDFQAEFRGAVIRPEDAMYEQAHRIFNARFDRHPDLIVRPVDAEDARIIEWQELAGCSSRPRRRGLRS